MINIHASLLPRWRGAAPIQRAIMAGDKVTGITIQQMVAELDAGDILLQQEVDIGPDDSAETIAARMAEEAASLVVAALDGIEEGIITARKQDEAEATYADKITEGDTEINWSQSAESLSNQIRGLNPKPGVYTTFKGMLLKVWKAYPTPELTNGEPGTVVHVDKNEGVYVATGDIPLRLVEVQPANKKRMSGAEFARGYRISAGDTLG
jgi:methionyl-tRNA formyltransferase